MAGGSDEIDVEAPDDSICPVCRGTTYVGETISCETCMYWFHFECVGVSHSDDFVQREDVPYYCPTCSAKEKEAKKKKQQAAKPKKAKKEATPQKEPKIKLKICLPPPPPPPPSPPPLAAAAAAAAAESSSPSSKKRKKSSVSVEKDEEAWLDAVEAGEEHVEPEMKHMKDPKLMTARQRAMASKEEFEGHMSLEFGGGRKKEDNNGGLDAHEVLRQKAIRSARRKEMEMEKREESKKKTMDRLLKKKEVKVTKASQEPKAASRKADLISYRLTRDGTSLSYPEGVDYPLVPIVNDSPAKRAVPCSVCKVNPKIYSCSKTHRPLCSLSCYKANMEGGRA